MRDVIGESGGTASGLWKLLVMVLALLFCTAVGYYAWSRMFVSRAIQRADSIELTQTVKRWLEAGAPKGDDLLAFLHGRRADLVVSNRIFVFGQSNLATEFALTNLHARSGTLFVTSKEVLVWLKS